MFAVNRQESFLEIIAQQDMLSRGVCLSGDEKFSRLYVY